MVAAVQMHGCKWAQLARLGVVAGRSAKAMRTNYARLGDAKRMRLVAELTQASAAGQTTARWGTASASDTAAAAEKAGREEVEAVAQRGAGRGKAAAARQCAEEDETVEVDAGRRGGELGTGAVAGSTAVVVAEGGGSGGDTRREVVEARGAGGDEEQRRRQERVAAGVVRVTERPKVAKTAGAFAGGQKWEALGQPQPPEKRCLWQGRPWHYRLKFDAEPDRNHRTERAVTFTKLWDLHTAAPGVKVMAVVFKRAVAIAKAELVRRGIPPSEVYERRISWQERDSLGLTFTMEDTLPTLLAEHDQVPFLCGPAMGEGRFLRADELAQKMGLDTTTAPFTVLVRRLPSIKVVYEAVALSLHRAFADFLACKGWEAAGWAGSQEVRTYASLYSGGVDAFYLACRRLGPLKHRLAAEKDERRALVLEESFNVQEVVHGGEAAQRAAAEFEGDVDIVTATPDCCWVSTAATLTGSASDQGRARKARDKTAAAELMAAAEALAALCEKAKPTLILLEQADALRTHHVELYKRFNARLRSIDGYGYHWWHGCIEVAEAAGSPTRRRRLGWMAARRSQAVAAEAEERSREAGSSTTRGKAPARSALVVDEETQLPFLGVARSGVPFYGSFPVDTSEIVLEPAAAVVAAAVRASRGSRSRSRGVQHDPLVDAPRLHYLPAGVASMLCFAPYSERVKRKKLAEEAARAVRERAAQAAGLALGASLTRFRALPSGWADMADPWSRAVEDQAFVVGHVAQLHRADGSERSRWWIILCVGPPLLDTGQVEIRAITESVHPDGRKWWRRMVVDEEEIRVVQRFTPDELEERWRREREAPAEEPAAAMSEEAALEEVRARLRASWVERCVAGLLREFEREDEEEQPRRAAMRTYAGGEAYQPRSTQSGRFAASSVAASSAAASDEVEKEEAGVERLRTCVGRQYQAEVEPLWEEEWGCACRRRWCKCRPGRVGEPLVLDDEREGELIDSEEVAGQDRGGQDWVI